LLRRTPKATIGDLVQTCEANAHGLYQRYPLYRPIADRVGDLAPYHRRSIPGSAFKACGGWIVFDPSCKAGLASSNHGPLNKLLLRAADNAPFCWPNSAYGITRLDKCACHQNHPFFAITVILRGYAENIAH
jgi:hypothetical protein